MLNSNNRQNPELFPPSLTNASQSADLLFSPNSQPRRLAQKNMEQCRPPSVDHRSTSNMEPKMSKTNARELQKRAEQQVKNTSAGGHLGGTYFGQQPDGKTASDSSNDSAKARPNDGN
jgi:hypothetical protein